LKKYEIHNPTLEGYAMKKDTTNSSSGREGILDALSELLREGACRLISEAVEAKLEAFLERYGSVFLIDGRRAVVRNGY
jgi:hypothetical protein